MPVVFLRDLRCYISYDLASLRGATHDAHSVSMKPNWFRSGKLITVSIWIVEIICFKLYDTPASPVTSTWFDHPRSGSNTRCTALLVCLEVVAVSLTTTICELFTAASGWIVEPFFYGGPTGTSFRWDVTDTMGGTRLFRSEPVFVASASRKHKSIAATGNWVVEKILHLSWAGSSLLWK